MNVAIHTQTNPFTGTAGALPQNSAFLIQKRSSLAGRRHRGRFYLPGVGEGGTSPTGVLSAPDVVGINQDLAAWLLAIQSSSYASEMVILHSTGISGAPSPTAVVSLNVDEVISTQRRRLRP
jgi:hypothetical protein